MLFQFAGKMAILGSARHGSSANRLERSLPDKDYFCRRREKKEQGGPVKVFWDTRGSLERKKQGRSMAGKKGHYKYGKGVMTRRQKPRVT